MIYLLIAALMAGFGGGFLISHELDKVQLWEMQSAIKRQKIEAETVLKDIIKKVEQQTQEQIDNNTNLESARNAYLKTAVALHDSQSAMRLRVPITGACRGSTVPTSDHTKGLTRPEADTSELSAESTGYLRGLALSADQCAINHNALLTFVQSGCGLNERAD